MSRLFFFALVPLLAPTATAQSGNWGPLYQFDGASGGDVLGTSVASGDINGDGVSDLVAGSPSASPSGLNRAGSVFVWSGADGSLIYQVDGALSGSVLGQSVGVVGDLNGDNCSEWIVGAPGENSNTGSARVYSGSDGSLLFRFDATTQGDFLGSAVSGAGDVNMDGTPDFIVGSSLADPGGNGNAGIAYVWSGSDGSFLYQFKGSSPLEYFGRDVDGAGDVNADGFADVIVGGWGSGSGHASVFSGMDGSLLYRMDGQNNEGLGYSVSGCGDLNSDGYSDFMAGAVNASPGGSFSGSTYVWSGIDGSLLYQFDGTSTYEYLGSALSSAGDSNGDGIADLLVGSPAIDWLTPGSASLYSGADGTLIHRFVGGANGDAFGWSLCGVGDLNGDGLGEIMAGAKDADPNGNAQAGSVYVFGLLPSVPPILAVSNLVAGQKATIQVDNGTPRRLALVAYSLKGGGSISTPWGTAMVTPPLNLLRPLRLDVNGSATKFGTIRNGTSGTAVWFQALDLGSKSLSNGLALTVQ